MSDLVKKVEQWLTKQNVAKIATDLLIVPFAGQLVKKESQKHWAITKMAAEGLSYVGPDFKVRKIVNNLKQNEIKYKSAFTIVREAGYITGDNYKPFAKKLRKYVV